MLVVFEAAHRLTAAQSIILAAGPSRLSSLGRLHHPLRQQQTCSWKVSHAAHALRDPNRDLIEFEVVWGPSIAFSKRSHQKSPAANGKTRRIITHPKPENWMEQLFRFASCCRMHTRVQGSCVTSHTNVRERSRNTVQRVTTRLGLEMCRVPSCPTYAVRQEGWTTTQQLPKLFVCEFV